MIERRKEKRSDVKHITLKGSTVAKIIYYKYITLPIITSLLSVSFLIYIITQNYIMIHSLKNRVKNIQEQTKTLKIKEQKLKRENQTITRELAESDTYLIDTNKVMPLIKKIINFLKIQNLISDAKIISIENDSTYQNVANISLQVYTSSKYLDTQTIKDILKIILKEIVYLKDINLQGDIINISLYKKVTK